MKKLLFLFAMMLMAATGAWAYVEVEVDGLRYRVQTGASPVTAQVIAPAEGVYTGEITIPSSINYNGEDITVDFIRSDAFKNATITKVTIPSTVYFIGGQAFYHCENLTEITLPEGLQEISSSAFSGCPFTTLTIPGTVTKIGSYGFEGLSNLQKLTFAYSAEKLSMSGNEFNGANNITELVIDRDYKYGNNKSLGQNSVKKVTFGEHVTRVPGYACYRMSLEELTIGANVTTIGNNAFMLCTFPEGYTFPFAQIKEIEDGGFYLCKSLPANLDLSGVEILGGNAFRSCDYLTSITLGDNLTEIGGEAFYECKGLTTITIPASVMTIGGQAFYGCNNLTNIDIPYSTQQLEMFDCPFGYCPADIRIDRPFKVTKKQSSYNPTVSRGAKGVIIGPNVSSVPEYAFYDNSKLEKVTFESSSNSISINSSAFTDSPFTELVFDRTITYSSNSEPMSTALTKATVGPNIANYLGYLNLKKCPDLAEVVFMDGCKKVPSEAFRNMTKLSTVTLPEGLETIESYAFNGCTALAAITLPEGLKTISQQAFTGTAITSVTVPGTARSMSSAFKGCEQLTSLTLAYSDNLTDDGWMYGKGVLTSDGSAFDGSPITDVTIDRAWKPNVWDYKAPIQTAKRVTFGPNATNIPDCMFKGLTIESATIGENVTEVGNRAFQNCTLPEGITILFAQFKKIGDYAFEVCAGVPATLNLDVIEEIGSYAFQNCTSIESLIIGGGTIGTYAFNGCSNIASITLKEGVTEVGQANFQNLTNLATVSLPSTLKKIGADAFANCTNLTIPNNLPEGLLTIGVRAFNGCKKLVVTIPSTVTSIGQAAFSGCESLTEVTIPAGVTSLGMSTFSGCTGLTQIVIPGTLKSISTYDFDCPNVTDVTIEYGEEPISMNDVAFGLRPHFTNVYIDRDFKWINNRKSMFGDSENITFGPHVTAIPEMALYQMSNVKKVTMTDNVTSIGANAFYFALNKDTEITLSKNLETIGDRAFYWCRGPKSIVLPFKLNTIGRNAFFNYNSNQPLENIYVPWLTPLALEEDEAQSGNTDTKFRYYDYQTLWVPGGTMEAYKAANVWGSFKKFEYWSFVVTADVTGKGQLDLVNGEEVTDNGTNTALSLTGAKLVGEGASEAVRGLFVREKDLTLTPTAARGYELTALTANGEAITPVEGVYKVENLLADQEIHGTFTPIIYNITYNNLLNSTLPEGKTNPATYIVEDADIKLVNPERIGYTFEGWTGTDLEGAQMEVVIPFNSIGDREYTATWKPIVYPITYDLAGGAVASANPADYTIETPNFTLTNPTKLGYTFTGWEGTDLTEKTLEVTVTTGHWGERSYTATWEPNPYKVAFNANNGEGTMAEMNFLYDAAQNLSANTFTRTGYIFAGWNSKADGTGTAYTDGQEVINLTAVRDEVVTMYAQWTPIHYTVAFNANSGEGTMADQAFTYDEAQKLTQNTFERRGYSFEGWNTKADGSGTAYADKAEVVNLTAEDNATVTMFAQWKVVVYTITYDLGGGTVATANPTEYTIESDAITLVNPTQEGYTFMGWTGTDLEGVQMDVTIAKGSIGNRTYTAVWNVNQYTITFDSNGGSDVEAITQNYNSAITAPEAPTRDGYTFKGWNPELPATMPAGDMTVTAQWELNVYSITYDLAGGELAPGESNPEEYTIESEAITLKNPTKKYYTFAGWTGTDLTEPTETVTIAKGSFGDRSYTATWEVEPYVLGDINGDGVVDVSDYIGVANHIMGQTPVGFNEMAGDVDINGIIDVSDYIGVANIILTGNVNGTQQSRATRHESQRKAAADTDLTAYDNVIYVAPQTIEPSETATTITLSICMKNTADIRGFQFDMYLPDGVTAKKNAKGKIQGVAFNADRLPEDDEHTITVSAQADGAIRFLVGSMYDETFTGNDGELMTMEVEVAANLAEGDYPIVLKNMKLTETDISKFYEASEVQTTLTVTTTTGISTQWASLIGKPVYDLRGLKVADEFNPKRLPAGVYIVEGRKVAVKK